MREDRDWCLLDRAMASSNMQLHAAAGHVKICIHTSTIVDLDVNSETADRRPDRSFIGELNKNESGSNFKLICI